MNTKPKPMPRTQTTSAMLRSAPLCSARIASGQGNQSGHSAAGVRVLVRVGLARRRSPKTGNGIPATVKPVQRTGIHGDSIYGLLTGKFLAAGVEPGVAAGIPRMDVPLAAGLSMVLVSGFKCGTFRCASTAAGAGFSDITTRRRVAAAGRRPKAGRDRIKCAS